MEIKVRFFTYLREIVGKREETLSFPSDSKVKVNTVLEILSRKYGEAFIEYLYNTENGKPKNFLQFLINGNSVSTLKGLDTELCDNDVLAILPPVGGG